MIMITALSLYYYSLIFLFLNKSSDSSKIIVEARSSLQSQFHRNPHHSFLFPQQQAKQHYFKTKWGLQKLSHIRGGTSTGGKVKDIIFEDKEETKVDDSVKSRTDTDNDKIFTKTLTKSSHDSYTTIGILHIPSSLNNKSEKPSSSNSFDLIQTSASCIAIVNNNNEDHEDDNDSKKYDISLGKFSSSITTDPSEQRQQDDPISIMNDITAETIGISSEILFIFMPSTLLTTTTTSQQLLQQQKIFQSLQHGIERRCKAGWSKPKVVIIMLDVADASKTTRQELQQKFVFSDVLGTTNHNHDFWSPHYMESLDILFDEDELYQIWKDLLLEWQNEKEEEEEEEKNNGGMITQELFPKFVKQVTHSLLSRKGKDSISTALSMQWSVNTISIKNNNAKKTQNNIDNHTVTTDVTQESDQDKQDKVEVVVHEVSVDDDGDIDVIAPENVKHESPLEQEQVPATTTAHVRRHDDIINNNKHEHDNNPNDDDIDDEQHWVDVAQSVMMTAREKMAILATKQEDVWLHYLDNDDDDDNKEQNKNGILGRRVPLLEFGQDASTLLAEASESLKDAPSPIRTQVLMDIASGELRHLYHQQLQSLREHYGRMYEKVLDQTGMDSEDDDESRQTKEHMKTEAASQATEGFRVAAQHAIPNLCQPEQELEDADYSYVSILQGLLSDMMEATTLRQDDQALLDANDNDNDDDDTNVDGEGGTPTSKRQRRYTWYEKLAARVVVLGVNYLQGWLAWQGIRKAAAERDRQMPKFPLF